MQKRYNCFIIFIVIICLTGCSRSIKIDTANKSSDLNQCEILFGEDIKTLKYENTFLLQTGTIDTTDEHPPIPAAIIFIDKKEVILNLVKNQASDNQTNSIYEGGGYTINLSYKKEMGEYYETIYSGQFTIENKEHASTYKVVGIKCNL